MAPPHTVTQTPVIPGWITTLDPATGRLQAQRIPVLSDYQVEYGCRHEVDAIDPRELEWLCLAATVHAEMVARAERQVRDGR